MVIYLTMQINKIFVWMVLAEANTLFIYLSILFFLLLKKKCSFDRILFQRKLCIINLLHGNATSYLFQYSFFCHQLSKTMRVEKPMSLILYLLSITFHKKA